MNLIKISAVNALEMMKRGELTSEEYVNAFLMIILIAYASLAAPRLPENIARLFDYPLTKLIVFFLIVYLAKHNVSVAIVSAVAVLITLMTLNNWYH